MYWHNLTDEMCFSYKRMVDKDVILDRILFSFHFPTKEWRRRMSYWTGPCFLFIFLQKNGGEGCHTGQDLVFFTRISYKRMEEKDVIVDRTLSIILPIFQLSDGTASFISFQWY